MTPLSTFNETNLKSNVDFILEAKGKLTAACFNFKFDTSNNRNDFNLTKETQGTS